MSLNLFYKPQDEDDKHNSGTDRYLITYADLITLLLGLFVILYASAQIDEEKFKDVSAALSSYFKSDNPASVNNAGNGNLNGGKSILPNPIISPNGKNEKTLEEIKKDSEKKFENLLKNGKIRIEQTSKGLVITMQEELLFKSGSASIERGGLGLLDTLAGILQGVNYEVEIDGHTDSDPIRTFKYESNWHLSGSRAVNVAYSLIMRGVPESNMSFRGFGAQRPIAENSTLAGKAINRRVEITISELPPGAPSEEGYSDVNTALR